MEGSGLDFSLFLETVNNISVRPSDFVRQSLWNGAYCQSRRTRRGNAKRTLMVQNFRPGFNRRTRSAEGTTIFFFRSYGGGIPSKSFSRSRAAAPRAV